MGFLRTLLLVVLLLPSLAHAAPDSTAKAYEKARKYYLELSSSDPAVSDLMEWERAASFMLSFLKEHPDPEYTPRVLLGLGRLYEQMWIRREFRTGLTRATYFYERLSKEYKGHALADDALLYLGDLRRNALKDEVAARAAYFEIVDVYPDGDMAAKARSRLGITDSVRPPATKAPQPSVAATATPVPTLHAATPAPTPSPTPTLVAELEEEEDDGLLSVFSSQPKVGKEGKEIFADSTGVRRPVIVIDPGHGGTEEGAHGLGGVLEKDVVLTISMLLDELLRERLRARTVLTRTSDMVVSLADRTKIANENNADLFISVHANASEYKTAHGIETYYLDNTNDRSSLKLAERENQSALISGGSDLDFIMSDLIQNVKLDDSISLAHHIQGALYGTVSRYYKGVKNLGVKKAPFYVLVGAHMPCVLVEVSFIDHPIEGERLSTKRYQKLVALALYEGVRNYFEAHGK